MAVYHIFLDQICPKWIKFDTIRFLATQKIVAIKLIGVQNNNSGEYFGGPAAVPTESAESVFWLNTKIFTEKKLVSQDGNKFKN